MAKKASASTATIHLTKAGPNGRPLVELALVGQGNIGSVAGALSKNVTRNAAIMKKLGLKACPSCISGMDIWIRHRFDDVITAHF